MKPQRWLGSRLTLALAGFTLALGCASDADRSSAADGSASAASTNSPSPAGAALTDTEATETIAPEAVQTSPGVDEVVKLYQANVEESVMLAYIDGSNVAYSPGADEILYLNDIGLPQKVIEAMIQHGRVLRAQAAKMAGSPTAATVAKPGASVDPSALTSPPPAWQSFAPPPSPESGTVNAAPASYAEPAYVPAPYESPQPPATVNSFYEPLSPYGSWMEIPDYGWGWQPTVAQVAPTWGPYCDQGRWLYTDCGWYWQSDYSWGWAPFHYGRWLRHSRYGWVWFPDTVWGPAWVSWRTTPLYCGWAPLPPAACYELGRGFTYYGVGVGYDCDFGLGVDAFTFVSYRHFYDRRPHDYFVSGGRRHDLYRESTLANHYFLGPNKTIINEGMGRDRVAAFTRGEIRKIGIRDLPPAAGKNLKPDRPERVGNSLVIYRPRLQAGPPALSSPIASRSRSEGARGGLNPTAGRDIFSRSGRPSGATATSKPSVDARAASVATPRESESVTRTMRGGMPITTVERPGQATGLSERQPIPLSPVPAYSGLSLNNSKMPAGASPATAPQSVLARPDGSKIGNGNGTLPPKLLENSRTVRSSDPMGRQSPNLQAAGNRLSQPEASAGRAYWYEPNRNLQLWRNDSSSSANQPITRTQPYRQELTKPPATPDPSFTRDLPRSTQVPFSRGTYNPPAYNPSPTYSPAAPAPQRSITIQPSPRSFDSAPARSVQPVTVPSASPRTAPSSTFSRPAPTPAPAPVYSRPAPAPAPAPSPSYSRPAPAPAPAPVSGRDPARDRK